MRCAFLYFAITPYGLPWDSPADRVVRLEEAIQVIKLLWSSSREEPVNFNGNCFQLNNAFLSQLPKQKPHPPIFVGAFSSKNALRVVGRQGDGWYSWLNTPNTFRRRWNIILEAAQEAERPSEKIQPASHIMVACMNEIPLGYNWPGVKERIERLEEAIQIMKMLWSKEFVTFQGKYYTLSKANLYTKPETEVPLYVAAFGPKVAKIAGKYADGFLTTLVDPDRFRNVLLKAVAEGAKEMGRDPDRIDKTVELGVAYDEDYDKALRKVRFWRGTLIPSIFNLPIYDPREIEQMGQVTSDEALAKAFFIATKPEDILQPIERAVKMGFNHVYLQSTSPDESKFLDMASKHIVPYVKSAYGNN